MLIPLIVLAVALVMIGCEVRMPGRKWPHVAGWWLRAALLNAAQVGIVFLAGISWDGWMRQHRPWSADALGVTGGAIVGYLAAASSWAVLGLSAKVIFSAARRLFAAFGIGF